jgi:hypothetical protein
MADLDHFNPNTPTSEPINHLPQNEEQITVTKPCETNESGSACVHIIVIDGINLSQAYERDGVCCSMHIFKLM